MFHFFRKREKTEPRDNRELESVLRSLEKNEIMMEVESGEGPVAPNASKIGGKPWLPAGFEWPRYTDPDTDESRPLSFLCQIDLGQVKDYDRERLLPGEGMLYFFYECESFRWGFDPEDRGSARVFYYEDTGDFVPVDVPEELAREYTVPEMAVRFVPGRSYPGYEEIDMHRQVDCDWDEYDAVCEHMGVELGKEEHKLLGYATVIQNEMLTECERVSRGIYCGGAEQNTSEEEWADITRRAKDWTLLLQLSTLEHEDWELMWGDCGMLYFYIRKQDLAQKQFDRAWFALQCG